MSEPSRWPVVHSSRPCLCTRIGKPTGGPHVVGCSARPRDPEGVDLYSSIEPPPGGLARLQEAIRRDRGEFAPAQPVTLCGAPDGTERRADDPAWPGVRAADSPRWCDICGGYGDHHTDRHPDPRPRLEAPVEPPFYAGTDRPWTSGFAVDRPWWRWLLAAVRRG